MPTNSLQSLTQFVRDNPSAIAMFDRDMRYMAASRRWKSDFKLDQDLIGLSHYEVFPEIPDAWKAIHRRALSGETIRSDGERFQQRDGTVHWLQWLVEPWYEAESRCGGIVMSSHEIPDPEAGLDGSAGKAALPGAASGSAASRTAPSRSAEQLAIIDELRLGNFRLADMPDELYALVRDELDVVTLAAGQVLVDYHRLPDAIVFPLEGLSSIVRLLNSGAAGEILKIGRGCHGCLSVLLESSEMEAETIVLAGGAALSIRPERFRQIARDHPALREWFQRFVAVMMIQVARSAVCATSHSVRERVVRWLLGASNSLGKSELPITQETIATLLGVRRTGISEVLSELREIGLIDTARGVIRIKDPVRLAAVACECWPADVAMRMRLIEGAPGRRYRDDVDVPALVKRYHALARARSGAGHLPG